MTTTSKTSPRKKSWAFTLLALFLILALLLLILFQPKPPPNPNAVGVAFLGYTNLPGNDRPFALFSINNRAEYDLRWRGDWVETEGDENRQARITNPSLPGGKYDPVLKSGQSLTIAAGKPTDPAEKTRWRFVSSFSRYDIRERWFDLSLRKNVPLKIGPILMANPQQILDPTNRTAITSDWLPN